MYILIRGSVEVRIKNKDIDNTEIPFITLYDGDYFGELAAIKDQKILKKQAEEWGRYDIAGVDEVGDDSPIKLTGSTKEEIE